MKKLENKYTNDTFENIKHVDEYGNEFWFARELQKVLEYKDWSTKLEYKTGIQKLVYKSSIQNLVYKT